jgi:hypothetical protein
VVIDAEFGMNDYSLIPATAIGRRLKQFDGRTDKLKFGTILKIWFSTNNIELVKR